MAQAQLILYSRPACTLCEHLEDQLHEHFAGRFQLDWRDVDRDPEARSLHAQRIPVLTTSAGEEICVGTFDAQSVARALERLESPVGPV
ncbi:MAG: hypothetical protein EVA65_00155 [Oceanococcus sp.]|nr:MAG: hypothetical protein EVA65_00155 [Oceanococcus sp.]